jgi:DNA primase
MNKKVEMVVGGKTLAVSNLAKVLYPKAGFTKGQVIDYYIRISSVLLPHLKNRPITLKRYPDGVEGFFFYEKQCPCSLLPCRLMAASHPGGTWSAMFCQNIGFKRLAIVCSAQYGDDL